MAESGYRLMPDYEPGEPYEFPDIHWAEPGLMRYRCFRGKCRGTAVLTTDRNTHNSYHNHKDE